MSNISCSLCGRFCGFTPHGSIGNSISGWWHWKDIGSQTGVVEKDLDVDHAPSPVAYRIAYEWIVVSGRMEEPIRRIVVQKYFPVYREPLAVLCLSAQDHEPEMLDASALRPTASDALFDELSACEMALASDYSLERRAHAEDCARAVERALGEYGWRKINNEWKQS